MRALLLLGAAALAPRGAGAAGAATIYRQFTAAPHVPGVLEANRHPSPHPVVDVEAHGGGRPPAQPPPPPVPGIHFSSVFSDNAVLQREPAQAALYGVVAPEPPPGSKIVVKFQPPLASEPKVTLLAGGTFKALLPPTAAGGNYMASASCASCTNSSATTLVNLTFGEVWFCSGQSNMQLPLENTFDRNATKRAILDGHFTNLRISLFPPTEVMDGAMNASDMYSPTRVGGPWYPVATRLPGKPLPGKGPPEEVWPLDAFSAHCFHTFQELSRILSKGEDNQTVPFGLIESAWGGTEVQNWVPNATLDAECKNLTGGKPNQAVFPAGSGNLWNGMVLPFVNMTIKGATWFQGENNCAECDARCDGTGKDKCHGATDPANVCGNILENSGYPCYLNLMIKSWRSAWSAEPGTTAADFPFGIQTLQSTEGSCGNGAFRWAQALNEATLPSKTHPKVFLAQGFDAQDPAGDSGWPTGVRGCRDFGINSAYPMEDAGPMFTTPEAGVWDGTTFMMGPIHPRSKHIVGRRMALAAASTAYGRTDLVANGPTLKNCSVVGNSVQIFFDEERLQDDAVHVFPGILAGFDLPSDMAEDLCAPLDGNVSSAFCSSFGGISPLEVEYTVPLKNGTNVSVWIPTSLQSSAAKHLNVMCKEKCDASGMPKGCCTNYTRTKGWNSVTTHATMPKQLAGLPVAGSSLGEYITGVRYAWSASPCCPGIDRDALPCPPNSCPIRGWNSTLPANPFLASIVGGRCKCTPPAQCG